MKVIIAGSRTIHDIRWVERAMELAANRGIGPVSEVVSGHAHGVDMLGEFWARQRGLPVALFPVTRADWKRLGPSAGHKRNARMAAYASALVAVWDGRSPGTEGMISLARGRGLPTFVFDPARYAS